MRFLQDERIGWERTNRGDAERGRALWRWNAAESHRLHSDTKPPMAEAKYFYEDELFYELVKSPFNL